jgi:MYXO-CTERM domain-containing protein
MGGCIVDADCAAGSWCNESMHQCLAQLPNGSSIPTDAPHMNPTLDGSCTPAAGTLVCESGVCDGSDNRCGYANGNGPCTSMNGGTVCRSGQCSMSGTCEPMGGCNRNADCTNPNLPVCDTTSHTCSAKSGTGGGGGNGLTRTFFGGGFCGVTSSGEAGGDALAVALVLLMLGWRARRRAFARA